MAWLERVPAPQLPQLKRFAMPRRELIVRAALNVCIVLMIALGVTAWITAPLFLVGVAATAELALRDYSDDGVEKILLGCGALVTVLILIGLFLNLTPFGLTRASWAAMWLVLSTAVLYWRRNSTTTIRRGDIRSYLARHWVIGLYGIGALGIFVAAVYIAMAGVWSWNQRPMLEFSLVSKNVSRIAVKIHAISVTGTYRIVAWPGSLPPQYLSSPISVNADGNGETLVENVPISVPGRWTIYLSPVSGATSPRELIVNVGLSS